MQLDIKYMCAKYKQMIGVSFYYERKTIYRYNFSNICPEEDD